MASDRRTSYDVRVWKTEIYEGKRATTYRVRWRVANQIFKEVFRTTALAESFRSELVSASRSGEAFDVEAGLPLSKIRRRAASVIWYDFACSYIDMKWPDASPKHRKSTAEALVTITMALLTSVPEEDGQLIRSALMNWAFNSIMRESPACPVVVKNRLTWVRSHSHNVVHLEEPDSLKALLAALGKKVGGAKAAPRTAALKRNILSNALNYAVESEILHVNPLAGKKVPGQKVAVTFDGRTVINPKQAQTLLEQVERTPRTGNHLVAFFGTMYYAALRPEEAVSLRLENLLLPTSADSFGWLTIDRAAPENGKRWSDDGERRHERGLKHRPEGSSRRIPCPPPLVKLLRDHLSKFGTGADGRLFRNESGNSLSSGSYTKLWSRARKEVFTEAQIKSPLARRPYDLRHACVSTWLSNGVPPTQVAEWAGHSVAILLRVYAKSLDNQEASSLAKIAKALSEPSD